MGSWYFPSDTHFKKTHIKPNTFPVPPELFQPPHNLKTVTQKVVQTVQKMGGGVKGHLNTVQNYAHSLHGGLPKARWSCSCLVLCSGVLLWRIPCSTYFLGDLRRNTPLTRGGKISNDENKPVTENDPVELKTESASTEGQEKLKEIELDPNGKLGKKFSKFNPSKDSKGNSLTF